MFWFTYIPPQTLEQIKERITQKLENRESSSEYSDSSGNEIPKDDPYYLEMLRGDDQAKMKFKQNQ